MLGSAAALLPHNHGNSVPPKDRHSGIKWGEYYCTKNHTTVEIKWQKWKGQFVEHDPENTKSVPQIPIWVRDCYDIVWNTNRKHIREKGLNDVTSNITVNFKNQWMHMNARSIEMLNKDVANSLRCSLMFCSVKLN